MIAIITHATLPPVKGYVEVERNGERCYKNVETGAIYSPDQPLPEMKSAWELAKENTELRAQISALTDRNDFVEDCIAELATIVYE